MSQVKKKLIPKKQNVILWNLWSHPQAWVLQ